METKQSPDEKKSFFNRTNMIIIVTLVVAFTVLAYQFDEDPLVEPVEKEPEDEPSEVPISEGSDQINAEVTSVIHNLESETITFVGFAVNENDRDIIYRIDYYYNQTFLGSSIAENKELPGCPECSDHVFDESFTYERHEFSPHALNVFAVHNNKSILLPVNDNATVVLE